MKANSRKKILKLIRSPRSFVRDAVHNRMNKFVEQSETFIKASNQVVGSKSSPSQMKVSAIPKMTEHLVACSLIDADRDPSGEAHERVYLLTSVPFWRGRLGNQVRIRELADFVRQHFNLTVLYTGLLTAYDAKEIAAKGWSKNIRPLVSTNNALYYEQTLKDANLQKPETYAGSVLTKQFIASFPCRAIIVEYITHEPYIRGLDAKCLRIIDTHDIMSLRMQAFAENGRDHHIKMSEAEEIHWLDTFDKVVAIQSDEYEFLSKRIDPSKLILSHHAVPARSCLKQRTPRRLVYMAGKNPANLDSIQWFLKRVLPLVDIEQLEVHIYGAICGLISKQIVTSNKRRLHLHWEVENQHEVYSAGDIVINPVLYGGGLKIKTVEAMAHGLPMVTTDEGARGLLELANRCFLVANNAEDFARNIMELHGNEELRENLSSESIRYTETHFSPESCFHEIVAAINNHPTTFASTIRDDAVSLDACPDNYDRTLILAARDFPFFAGASGALEKYQNAIYLSAGKIRDLNHFSSILTKNCIDRVLINNPFISEKVATFYRYAVSSGISVTTFDRGALPDSWFFDNRGFNGDSESYSPELWDKPISDSQRDSVDNYVDSLFSEGKTLEAQGTRIGAAGLREKLGIGKRKVLFVAFQRPNDTVVRYFGGQIKGMEGFCSFVNEACLGLNQKEWAVIGKRHPLETEDPTCLAQMVPSDTHVNDLLNLADAVLIINSGVGVLSLLANKPTYVCGEAFYNHDGLAERVNEASELNQKLTAPSLPDPEKVARFTKYLMEDFYSFGTADGYLRRELGGELSPITTGITFKRIRGISPMPVHDDSGADAKSEHFPYVPESTQSDEEISHNEHALAG